MKYFMLVGCVNEMNIMIQYHIYCVSKFVTIFTRYILCIIICSPHDISVSLLAQDP